jgi:hypothetical protein
MQDRDEYDAGDSQGPVLGKEPEDLVLCYLSCSQDAGKAYIGAILITDSRARPLEFAFVDRIQPTTMQRLLYGRTLDEYIRADVIAKKLYGGLSRKPDVVFVDAVDLLAIRRLTGVPVAQLLRNPSSSPETKLSTITFQTSENSGDYDTVSTILGFLEPRVELLEPFSRMDEALKEALRVRAQQLSKTQ